MDFERSTQARSWIFDEQSLTQCRREAAIMNSDNTLPISSARPRKFASGFHHRRLTSPCVGSLSPSHDVMTGRCSPIVYSRMHPLPSLSVSEHEAVVRFHAHQISCLVGPNAVLPELRSHVALSTAITLFRRFYLSNSITDFSPRHLSVAAAFIGAKLEEQPIKIEILSHATAIVQLKFKSDPLFCTELGRVSISEIEIAEKQLMEGVNYELRCHHPHNAIRILSSDFSTFLSETIDLPTGSGYGSHSPQTTVCPDDLIFDLHEEAMAIAVAASIVSDVGFLFPPGQIAFAAFSIAVGGTDASGRLGLDMRMYLRNRFSKRLPEDLFHFERQVSTIIRLVTRSLAESPGFAVGEDHPAEIAATRARELRRVLEKAAQARSSRQQTTGTQGRTSKRKRRTELTWVTSPNEQACFKVPRVTPTKLS